MATFERILVANRGEVACRVLRTCRRLGSGTVAVYSDADAGARHVREADDAVRIGPAPARASYLDAAAIVRAAVERGVDAIHPGYGFLSEKLELIDACHAAGIAFVGPHRDAIARMGSKIESKRIARAAGVACVPGYDGDDQDDAVLADAARALGFPLLIKASAGGGGKGMKRVDDATAFAGRLADARAEAGAAFGDERVLLERFIERPRHLEVQLLGDRHGGLVHLFERECSIQRNYQKLIEEAPAHRLTDAVRARLFDAALLLGRAIGYDSVGTVEFVLDADADADGVPYFLEMNTRLQVEHPVTELTTGIDLVEQQLRSAFGERLAFAQADVARSGWAIEARVNAEVPEQDFDASFGAVTGYDEPAGPGLRINSGVDGRSTVTPHYDAMLAKVIGFGTTRERAAARLVDGLRTLRIEGVRTNQALLADLLTRPAFDATLTTRYLRDACPDGWRLPRPFADERIAAAAAAWFFAATAAAAASDRPLDALTGFRLTGAAGRPATSSVRVEDDDALRTFVVTSLGPGRIECRSDDYACGFVAESDSDGGGKERSIVSPHRRWRTRMADGRATTWSDGDWSARRVEPAVQASTRRDGAAGRGDHVVADLPGVVTQLLVTVGQSIATGTPVAVVEAMKLFHTLLAPRDGVVAALPVAVGATVQRGEPLALLEAPAA